MNLIHLPVVSRPEYISPTAFSIFQHCNIKYYLTYLTGKRAEFVQTPQMAIGSLFDAIVKSTIAKDLNWYNKDTKLSLKKLMESSVDPIHHNLLDEAKLIFKVYKDSGAYDDLLAETVEEVEIENFKLIKDSPFKAGIPIFGKPDVRLGNISGGRITDWKVNGYGSKWGQSPKPGYCRLYDDYGRKPAHKLSWMPMEQVDQKWAEQLTIYNWIGEKSDVVEFKDIPVGIEQIVIRDGNVRVASFRNIITADFQHNLYLFLETMWTCINNEKFEEPQVTQARCFMYNKKCEVADNCEWFKRAFNDKDFNKMMGIEQ